MVPSWTNATGARPALRTVPPELPRPATATRAGVLRPADALRYFTLNRLEPSPRLTTWVEHYWTVRWELPPGAAYRSEVLTHPAVHLSVESGSADHHGFAMPAALLHGVVTRRFGVDLTGEGRVFGVKFRPGGFSAFTGCDVAGLTDRVVALGSVVAGGADLRTDVLGRDTDEERARVVDDFLSSRIPAADDRYVQLLDIVHTMLADRSLTTVDAVAQACAVPPRTLQRLFRRYVGVGPKWVLQRFRLHDATTLIDAGEVDDLAELAAELGWYDQAHFSRDFVDAVGTSPSVYAARSAEARARGAG